MKKTKTAIFLPLGEGRGGAPIIGSRGSALALWQANHVLNKLRKIGIDAKIKIIKTKGDVIQNLPWAQMKGKGFFIKEIENALRKKKIDLAVHSHKDLPTEKTKGLMTAAVSEREDPSELLLINKNAVDEKQKFSLKQNAVVGTSSARRKSQLLAWRNDLRLEDLRGNVPTRIQKLRDKKYDAILIANAGISRLKIDLSGFHCEKLDPREFIPAPAQGVLALQIRCPSPSLPKGERDKDKNLFDALRKINNEEVEKIVSVERKVMNLFEGGCQLPLGVYCERLTLNPSPKERGTTSYYTVRISIAKKWNSFPKYFYFESKKLDGFAKRIVERIKSPPPKAGEGAGLVLISRDEKQNDFFKRCLEANDYKVFCQSLIAIKSIPLKDFPKTGWIFFSSKNAVKHFFEQKPEVEETKFGAISKSTAEELRKYGMSADFIGNANNTKRTAKKFAALVGNKKVLFPQAKNSLRTVQQKLSKEQVIDLIVYETIKNNNSQLPVTSCQLLIFTSPSNVEAFFEKNKISVNQKIIAMGNATAKALKKFGIKEIHLPPSFDDLGLVQAVFSL